LGEELELESVGDLHLISEIWLPDLRDKSHRPWASWLDFVGEEEKGGVGIKGKGK